MHEAILGDLGLVCLFQGVRDCWFNRDSLWWTARVPRLVYDNLLRL